MARIQASFLCMGPQIPTTMEGDLKGKIAVETLNITACDQKNCPKINFENCLIGQGVEASEAFKQV